MKYTIRREITTEECPWLQRNYQVGEQVYRYRGFTYGCISDSGVACTVEENEEPFFELPRDALVDEEPK